MMVPLEYQLQEQQKGHLKALLLFPPAKGKMKVETGTSLPSEENLCGGKSMQFNSFRGDDDSIATGRTFSTSST